MQTVRVESNLGRVALRERLPQVCTWQCFPNWSCYLFAILACTQTYTLAHIQEHRRPYDSLDIRRFKQKAV